LDRDGRDADRDLLSLHDHRQRDLEMGGAGMGYAQEISLH
jgi:hypothetical protein